MADYKSWASRKADGQFLIDSGLLFEINHQVLHLVGLSLGVSKEGNISVMDARGTPDKLVYSAETILKANQKLQNFMREFGDYQIDKRRDKLGWSLQPKVYRG